MSLHPGREKRDDGHLFLLFFEVLTKHRALAPTPWLSPRADRGPRTRRWVAPRSQYCFCLRAAAVWGESPQLLCFEGEKEKKERGCPAQGPAKRAPLTSTVSVIPRRASSRRLKRKAGFPQRRERSSLSREGGRESAAVALIWDEQKAASELQK